MVIKDSDIESIEDLPDKVGSVSRGTSLVESLRQLGVAEEKIHYVEFSRDNYLAVAEGEADYTLVEETTAPTLLAETPGLKIAFQLPGEDRYAVAVAPGSELLEPLNRFLERLRASGELERVIQHRTTAAKSPRCRGERRSRHSACSLSQHQCGPFYLLSRSQYV